MRHVWGMAKRPGRKNAARAARIQNLLAEGQAAAAWTEARALLATRRNDPGVMNLAGVAAFQAGDVETGTELLRHAAERAPKNADIQMNLGNVLGAAGQSRDAFAAYQAAHDLAPAYPEPAFNAGVLLSNAGRFVEAAAWFAKALDRDPDHTQASIGRAEALRAAGQLAEAAAVLEALVAQHPDDAVAWTNLAAVRSARSDDAGARDAGEKAIAGDPGLAAAHYNTGVAEQAMGQSAPACERFRRALALQPDHAAAALNLGEAYLAEGDRTEAMRAFQRAIEIDPGFAKAVINLADMALQDSDAEGALAGVDGFLAHHPSHPAALAMRAFVLRALGRDAEALHLDDPDRFVRPHQITIPGGYDGIAGFNAALAEHILRHPSLSPSPAQHATRKGRHTGELLVPPMGPMADFETLIGDAFDAYRRAFVGEAAHPFLDACPRQVDLALWAVVMDEDGHQVPHIHPAAWLSGVYYVEVPDTVRADDPAHAGWLEFGRPPEDIHAPVPSPLRLERPEPGKMVLFPSYFYHRTVPLKGKNRRISMAFDVVPS